MEIVQTRNMQLAYSILSNPVIAKEISGNEELNHYPNNCHGYIYLTSFIKDKPIGLFIIHPTKRKEWKCHVQVLPEYRKGYSKKFGKAVVKWVWKNTEIPYLISNIGKNHSNVKEFAEYVGFNLLPGKNKKETIDNNEADAWKMKMSRPKI